MIRNYNQNILSVRSMDSFEHRDNVEMISGEKSVPNILYKSMESIKVSELQSRLIKDDRIDEKISKDDRMRNLALSTRKKSADGELFRTTGHKIDSKFHTEKTKRRKQVLEDKTDEKNRRKAANFIDEKLRSPRSSSRRVSISDRSINKINNEKTNKADLENIPPNMQNIKIDPKSGSDQENSLRNSAKRNDEISPKGRSSSSIRKKLSAEQFKVLKTTKVKRTTSSREKSDAENNDPLSVVRRIRTAGIPAK
jgi:hypothetical protein